jgi:hypothetical protein
MRRYYHLLGISPDATRRQIEEAYLEHMQGLESVSVDRSTLEPIQEAYAALVEPESSRVPRRLPPVQDVTPAELPQKPALIEPATSPQEHEPDVEVSLTRSFQTFHPSFDEIYDRLWSNFDQASRPKSETPESLTIDIPITARQAFHGGTARVLVPTRLLCGVCRGRGGVGPFVCLRCDGTGVLEGEYPLLVSFPGKRGDYTAAVSLAPLGIRNLYLRARFRVTGEDIETA